MNQALLDRFVEEVGMMFELEAGAPRMVGRVLGWLLVCQPAEQSAAELADELKASRGSISTATRTLLRMGLVERVRLRGERFDRFEARPAAWDEVLWRREQFSLPRRVMRLGIEALVDEPVARRARLEEVDFMYAWWEERIEALHQEFLADKARAHGGRRKGANR